MMNNSTLLSMAEQFGSPLYVFDEMAFAQRAMGVKDTLGTDVGLCYAMKANPFFTRAAKTCVDFFEVCSPGEFKICEYEAVDTKQIVLSGVYKSEDEIEYTMSRYPNIYAYTVESLRQYEVLKESAARYGVNCRIFPRLSSGNKFGMCHEDFFTVLNKIHKDPYLSVAGIHFFSGTQKKRKELLTEELTTIAHICEEAAQLGFDLEKVEYGPGLPVEYFGEESNSDDLDWIEYLSDAIQPLKRNHSVTIELGRYLAAIAGTYITKVVDIKCISGSPFCIVDGGTHHVNYFGQMLALKQPPVEIIPAGSGDSVGGEWTVGGALCTISDLLLKKFPHDSMRVGDLFVFRNIGAYSVTETGYLFLSRNFPSVVLATLEGKIELAREVLPSWRLNARDCSPDRI